MGKILIRYQEQFITNKYPLTSLSNIGLQVLTVSLHDPISSLTTQKEKQSRVLLFCLLIIPTLKKYFTKFAFLSEILICSAGF